MAESPYRPFTPKAEQVALFPDTSGNTINGLGETERRPATPIYWHNPDTLVHGELQKWFYTQNADNPHIIKAREDRAEILAVEVPPVSGEPLEQSAKEWTEQLEAHVATLDMDLFGVTAFRPEWAFEGTAISQKWIIMIGIAHDYDRIKDAPALSAGAEVVRAALTFGPVVVDKPVVEEVALDQAGTLVELHAVGVERTLGEVPPGVVPARRDPGCCVASGTARGGAPRPGGR